MTRADQLRQALEPRLISPELLPVYEAARFALKVWEGDEQLVEKAAAEISDGRWVNDSSPAIARAVLAAITEEEPSIDLISFNELDQGMKEALSRCKPCGGSGWRRYRDSQPIASDTYPCPDCGGTGRVSQ